jgi:hypothetical protein
LDLVRRLRGASLEDLQSGTGINRDRRHALLSCSRCFERSQPIPSRRSRT